MGKPQHKPILLLKAERITGSSGTLVAGRVFAGVDHATRLRNMANISLEGPVCVLHPSNICGVMFTNVASQALQLHLDLPDGMVGALSPPAYDHIIKVGRGAWQRACWVR